jgi:hypothetical protein
LAKQAKPRNFSFSICKIERFAALRADSDGNKGNFRDLGAEAHFIREEVCRPGGGAAMRRSGEEDSD